MSQESTTERPRTIYNIENPPLSRMAAIKRRAELDSIVTEIQTKLEQKHFVDFDGDDEGFLRWRRNATAALYHFKTEQQFLRRYFLTRNDANSDELYEAATPEVKQFIDFYKASFEKFIVENPLCFSKDSPPQTKHEIQDRHQKLLLILQNFSLLNRTLNEEAQNIHLDDGWDLKLLRNLAVKHWESLTEEYRYLKHLIKTQNLAKVVQKSPVVAHPRRWDFLLSLIDRALAKGVDLELTPDEHMMLQRIREEKTPTTI